MPNIKSAKKRVKVNKVKALANKSRNSELKTAIKKATLACAKNLMHKNKAARKKSQLAKMLNA